SAGAWLGLCTLLIPLGVLLAAGSSFEHAREPRGPGMLIGLVGIALAVAGIWLPVNDGGGSFWNASSSGHALGVLMLLLAAVNTALLVATDVGRARAGGLRVVAAAVTFGLLSAVVVGAAFENLGGLGSGAWLEACAGVLVLLGALRWSLA